MASIYSTAFTTNENPLSEGGQWAYGEGGMADPEKNGGVARATATATHCGARYKGIALSRQQYAKATNVNADNATVSLAGVCTRIVSDTNANGYYLYYRPNAGEVQFWKLTGNDPATGFSMLKAWTVTTASNITLELRSVGIRHFAFYQGTLLGTIWDLDYQDGQTGIALYATGAVGNATISDFDTGNVDTSNEAGFVPPNYTDFYGSAENPLSEGGFWSNKPGGWITGMQRVGDGTIKSRNTPAGDHSSAYYTGMLSGDQSAIAISDGKTGWSGVATRIQSPTDGSCYLAFVWSAPEGLVVRLLVAQETHDPFFATNHGPVAEASVTGISTPFLIELESRGNSHKVYITSHTSGVEGTRTLKINWTHPAAGAASGYLVNNGAGYAAGTTAVAIDTGSGSFAAGELIKFGSGASGYFGTYTVVSHIGSTLTFKTADQDAPFSQAGGLDEFVPDNTPIVYVARMTGGYPAIATGQSDAIQHEWWSNNLSGEWLLGSGGITMGGAADKSWTKAYSPSGGIVTGGSAGVSKSKDYMPSGGMVIDGTAPAVLVSSGYPASVFPLMGTWPMEHTLVLENLVTDFGDGYELRANFDLASSRADGEGGLTSYKGRNRFKVKLNAMDYDDEAKALWAFYKARRGPTVAFYFYNAPDERATIDMSGVDSHGRYLVRFTETYLTREKFTLSLYTCGIELTEVRA